MVFVRFILLTQNYEYDFIFVYRYFFYPVILLFFQLKIILLENIRIGETFFRVQKHTQILRLTKTCL